MLRPSGLDEVDGALRAHGARADRVCGAGWHVWPPGGPGLDARLAGDDWLEVSTLEPVPVPGHAAGGWTLLAVNGALDGGVRLGLEAGGVVRLRADLCIGADDESASPAATLEARFEALCHALAEGWRTVACPSGPLDAGEADAVMRNEDRERLSHLCAEAGWIGEAGNGPGGWRVTLDAPGGPLQARLTLEPGGALRAVVPLAAAPPAGCAGREAMARLLLQASSRSRAVKGIVLRDAGVERPALAAACADAIASPGALDRALSALAAGCMRLDRETRALEDETVARAYLAMTAEAAATGGRDTRS